MSEVDDVLDPNPCPRCIKWEIEGQHACFWCLEMIDMEKEQLGIDDETYRDDPYV